MGQIVVLHLEAHGYGYPITILVINHSLWFSPAQTSYNFFVESCQRHSNMVTDHVQLRCVAFLGKENRVMIIYMCHLNRGPWLLNHASYFGATSLLDQSSLLPRPLQLCPNRALGWEIELRIKDSRFLFIPTSAQFPHVLLIHLARHPTIMLEAGFSSLSLSSSSSTSHCSSPAQNKSLSVAVVKTMLGLDVHYSTLMIGNQLLTTKVFKTPWLMHALVCQTSSW